MKKRLLGILLVAAMSVGLLAACAPADSGGADAGGDAAGGGDTAGGGTEQTYTFKFASENVASHPRNVAMSEVFKPQLEELSGGRITVELHTDGVLGKETELMQMLPTNAIQGYRGGGYDNLNKGFLLWNAPFTFQSYEELMAWQESDVAQEIMGNLSDDKIYIPATGLTAFRQIVATKPIEHPSDLEGLKFRAPNQAPIMDFYTACGASPQAMSSSDAYMAMQTGAIDGACNNASTVDSSKWIEAAPYFAHTSYMAGADPFMVNAEWYNSLPDDLKKIFDEVSIEMVKYSDKLVADGDADSIQKLKDESEGYTEIITNPELAAEWQAATASGVDMAIERGDFTREQYDDTIAFLEEYRANNG